MMSETLSFASPLWQRTRLLWQRVARLSRRAPRRLRLRESLALGDHRFVAILECERLRWLIGGTASSLVVLAPLASDPGELPQSSEAGAFTAAQHKEIKLEEGPSKRRREAEGSAERKWEAR
jgi:hypothetical protein